MRPRIARADVFGVLFSAGLVVSFCLILLWHDPSVFWNDDYQISISPVFDDVARSWREGHWPLLSPYSWVCGNLAGEFQYGTFSIFVNAAVVIIWTFFHEFAHQAAALSIVHLVVLASGGYMLARGRGISLPLAVMVALIAGLSGWIICWGASDWFGALGAFAWLPWAWWGLEKSLRSSTPNVQLADSLSVGRWTFASPARTVGRLLSALWPAPFVYLLATGGFPYTIVMLIGLIGWLTIRAAVATKSVWAPVPMLAGAALGFGFAAPAILALLSHVHGSVRELQPPAAHWQWIVPPSALPGLILPSWTVKWADFSTRYRPHSATELACGLVAPVAVLCGIVFRSRIAFRRLGWDLALLGVVLIAAMLPTAGVFRWSFRWLPFFHLILALCAAECLALLGERKRIALTGLFLCLLIAAAMKLLGTGGTYALPLMWIMIGLPAVWIFAEYALSEDRALSWHRLPADGTSAAGRRHAPVGSSELSRSFKKVTASQHTISDWLPATITFASLLATYLCIPPNCGVPRYSFTEALVKPEPLDRARLYLSVYPGPEIAYRTEARSQPAGQIVRPGSTSMWAKLRFVNGYSPIRPAGLARQWFTYIHGDFDLGSVQWLLSQEARPGGVLAQAGVDGIVIAKENEFRPEPAGEWEQVLSNDEGRVFHRRGPPLGHVRSVSSIASQPDKQFVIATVSNVQDLRNSIVADVEVPGGNTPALLSFSRPYFDGYVASLGRQSLPVESDRGLYPIVQIPAGSKGRLILKYRPPWLIYGGAIAVTCTIVWMAGVLVAARRR